MERHLVSVDRLLRPAVDETVMALGLEDIDAAAVRLAESYADTIDAAAGNAKLHSWSIRWIGPELLKCLESLGATPAARKAVKTSMRVENEENPLAKLRASRASRVS